MPLTGVDSDTSSVVRRKLLEAPFSDEGWHEALTILSRRLHCASTSIEWHNLADGFEQRFSAHTNQLHAAAPGACANKSDLHRFPNSAAGDAPQNQPHAAGTDMTVSGIHRMEFEIESAQDVCTLLRLERPSALGEMSAEETQFVRSCLPLFRLAARQTRYLSSLRFFNRWTLNLTSEIGLGILLCTRDGKLRFANRLGREILNRNGELFENGRRLEAKDGETRRALSRAVRNAGEKISSPIIVVASLENGDPLYVRVVPGPVPPFAETGPEESLAGVLIIDPGARARHLEACLTRDFGFSNRQAQVAKLLMEGYSLTEVSRRLNISRETAKTHLKRVFELTDTSRQTQLIKFLASVSSLPDIRLPAQQPIRVAKEMARLRTKRAGRQAEPEQAVSSDR